jgi:uncharacterized protein YdeI (YjbR/CyaY-like superfamily)
MEGMAETKGELPILSFPSPAAWQAWLAAQPEGSAGLWLKLPKAGCPEASVTKAQAIEAALAHGWIDGQIDRHDADWLLTRFTPRKARSKWSANNRKTAERLIAEGGMGPRGVAEVERAKADGRWEAAYPSQSKAEVPDDLRAALDAAPQARTLFEELDAANRYAILYRIHDAKTAKTRAARIEKFVSMLARGDTIYPRKAKG